MIVSTEYADISVDNSPLRMFVAAPKTEAKSKYPGIIFYSDIFQLSSSMLRACVRKSERNLASGMIRIECGERLELFDLVTAAIE